MNFFGSKDTVDGKARSILSDLPEDPSPFEILRTVDQKASEDVDPDDVVATMRDLDDEVDAKLGAVEGHDVDQKEMREAASTIAEKSDLTHDGAMQLLSAVANGGVDQAALTNLTDISEMGTEPDNTGTDSSGTDPDAAPDSGVDQKQDDDDGDGGDMDSPLEMLNADARETVENFAELAGIDPGDAVAEVLGTGGGGGGDEQAAADMAAGGKDDYDRDHDQMAIPDQKGEFENLDLNERIAEAVTSDEVIDEMAGAVAQKMADDEEFADSLVETVDQKGDFVTTEDTVVTAPTNDSKTVGDAGAITGGDGE